MKLKTLMGGQLQKNLFNMIIGEKYVGVRIKSIITQNSSMKIHQI